MRYRVARASLAPWSVLVSFLRRDLLLVLPPLGVVGLMLVLALGGPAAWIGVCGLASGGALVAYFWLEWRQPRP